MLFFSSRRRHTRFDCDWSSDVCSSDLTDYAKTNFSSANPIDLRAFLTIVGTRSGTTVRVRPSTRVLGAPGIPETEAGGELEEIGRASCRKECRSRWSP